MGCWRRDWEGGPASSCCRREMSAQGRCCIKEKLEYKAGVNIL